MLRSIRGAMIGWLKEAGCGTCKCLTCKNKDTIACIYYNDKEPVEQVEQGVDPKEIKFKAACHYCSPVQMVERCRNYVKENKYA